MAPAIETGSVEKAEGDEIGDAKCAVNCFTWQHRQCGRTAGRIVGGPVLPNANGHARLCRAIAERLETPHEARGPSAARNDGKTPASGCEKLLGGRAAASRMIGNHGID